MDQRQIDISALNISTVGDEEMVEEPPKMTLAREKVIEEAKKLLDARGDNDKKGVSLVVVGKINKSLAFHLCIGQFIQKAMLMLGNRR